MKYVLGQRSDHMFPEDNNLADLRKFRTCRNIGPPPLPPVAIIPRTRPSTLARLWKPDLRHGGFSMASMCYGQLKLEGILAGDVLWASATKCIPVTVNLSRGCPPFSRHLRKIAKSGYEAPTCLSVRPSVRPRPIFIKFDIWEFFENPSRKFKFIKIGQE